MTTEKVIILARKYRDNGEMSSSARLCLYDAVSLYDAGKLEDARSRAIKSLEYSMGMFWLSHQSI